MSDINDVFISYRRVDVDFAKRLTDVLKDAGKEVWIDWEDIPPGSDSFEDDIKRGLETTDVFIAILSPDYLESSYCVDLELQYAVDLNKRVIPIVIREFDDTKIPQAISHINWIHFIPHAGRENTFDESVQRVIQAINTDLEHVREHKRILVRALEWQRNEKQPSYLLQGDEIIRAETWITRSSNRDPVPTKLHQEYIIASRDRSQRQLQRLFAGVSSALVVMTILVFIALFLFNAARLNANEAATQAFIAANNAATATNAQGEAIIQQYNAETQAAIAATNAVRAENNAFTAEANSIRAANNAATATNAQGEAIEQRYIAETQAAIAANNAATATNAQGVALEQRYIAETQAVIAADNAIRADNNAATAEANSIRAENNAATATNAQGDALEQRYIAETQAAIAATNAVRADNNAMTSDANSLRAENNASTADANAIRAENNAATATNAQGQALEQRYIAETQAAIADAERSRAQSIALAAQADLSYESSLRDRAALLAIAAVENYEYTVEAESALATLYRDTIIPQPVNTFDIDVAEIFYAPTSGASIMAGVAGDGVYMNADDTFIFRTDEPILGVAWSLDETQFATYDSNNVRVYERRASELIYSTETGIIRDITWTDEGLWILESTPQRELQVLTQTGKDFVTYTGHLGSEDLPIARFSNDSSLVVSSGADSIIHIWEIETTDTISRLIGHTVDVQDIVWSPDDSQIVSRDASSSRFAVNASTAKVWDWRAEQSILTIFAHEGTVIDVGWSPNGERILTLGEDDRLYIWDVASSLSTFDYGFATPVVDASWSPTENDILLSRANGDVTQMPLWDDVEELISLVKLCCIVRPLTVEESAVYGLPAPVSEPPPADNEFVCEGAARDTRMYVGALGRVSPDSNGRLNVRLSPEVNAVNLIQQLPFDTRFIVIDGPVCRDDLIWYQIVFGLDAVRGWIAEGDADEYFIEPILPTE